jgi:hypothetical protein
MLEGLMYTEQYAHRGLSSIWEDTIIDEQEIEMEPQQFGDQVLRIGLSCAFAAVFL